MTTAPHPKQRAEVLGQHMAYVEQGSGEPVLFLHGNPTSSYLWRDVMPPVAATHRCVAPDLIGMGDSAKLPEPGPESYRFAEHSRYIDAFIDTVLGTEQPLWLVLHDWGSGLGFDWACRHPQRVRGIAYMEAIVRPFPGWEDWSPEAVPIFQGFRSDAGEAMVLDRNLFVERVLPGSVLRQLSDEEMAEYRRPFARREDRWPVLTWPRELPIAGEPADVVARVQRYADWLAQSPCPKLFVNADPGAILTGAARDFCRSWPHQEEVTVPGNHFLQEDSGPAIGAAVADWIGRHEAAQSAS